jgi:nucleoside-diphosphate-sugar epimerase
MKKLKLGLVGCGWLGKALAKRLLEQSEYKILATSSHDRTLEFQTEGIPYICFDLNSTLAPTQLLECDIIIYTVPPLELGLVSNFFKQLSLDKKIIFTSSTSVYGKNLGNVNENSFLSKTNTSSPLLLSTEEMLSAKFDTLTIIRPGGLYGANRHPVNFLANKKNISGGHDWLHLVSQEDCINAIISIIQKNIWGEVFNLVSDLKTRKKDYYTEMANKFSLVAPVYLDEKHETPTQISNEKSKNILKISYLNPRDYNQGSL